MPHSQIVCNRVHRVVLVADELHLLGAHYVPLRSTSSLLVGDRKWNRRMQISRGSVWKSVSRVILFFFSLSWLVELRDAREKSQALTFHSKASASERHSRLRSLSHSRSLTVEKWKEIFRLSCCDISSGPRMIQRTVIPARAVVKLQKNSLETKPSRDWRMRFVSLKFVDLSSILLNSFARTARGRRWNDLNFRANVRDYSRSRKGTGTTAIGYIIHSLAGLPDRHRMAATENPTLNFNLEAVKVHRE